MFLVLGTPECKYCLESKQFLDERGLKYTYIDLTIGLGDNWRSIFSDLKSIIGAQRTIPIIFRSEDTAKVPDGLTSESLNGWTFVGGYFDLVDLVNESDLSISDDY